MSRLPPLLCSLAVLAQGPGCVPDFVVDPNARITCDRAANGECPADFRCSEELQQCIPVGQEAVAPRVAGPLLICRTTTEEECNAEFFAEGAQLYVRFLASEDLGDQTPRVRLIFPGQLRTMDYVSGSGAGPFVFSYLVSGSDAEARGSIDVRLVDKVGNQGDDNFPSVVEVDRTGPQLAQRPVRTLLLSSDNPRFGKQNLIDIDFARRDTVVSLFFAFRRPIAVDGGGSPMLSVEAINDTACALAFTVVEDFNPVFLVERAYQDAQSDCPTPDGLYQVTVSATDAAGNWRQVDLADDPPETAPNSGPVLTSFTLDTVAPLADTIRFDRVPWGSRWGAVAEWSGDASFSLSASLKSCATSFCGAEANGFVRLLDDADAARGTGIVPDLQADSGGAIVAAPLGLSDRTELYYSVFDRAGNETAARRIDRGTWRASLIGRRTGDEVSNPHRLTTAGVAQSFLADPAHFEPSSDTLLSLTERRGAVTVAAARPWRLQRRVDVPATQFSSMVYMGNSGRTLAIGGQTASFGNAGYFEFDGHGWRELDFGALANPGDRFAPGLAYDALRGRVVLVGGGIGEAPGNNRTWEWDGERWYDLTPQDGSTPLVLFSPLAFDASSGQTLVAMTSSVDAACVGGTKIGLGGLCSRSRLMAWDGVRWNALCDEAPCSDNVPAPRVAHGLVYDSANERVVLFGGYGCTSATCATASLLGDTWAWDGTAWQELIGASPAPRARLGATLVYDTVRAAVVSVGGCTELRVPQGDSFFSCALCGEADDECVLTGSDWQCTTAWTCEKTPSPGDENVALWSKTQIYAAALAPHPRNFGAAAFDSGRGRLLQRGGVWLSAIVQPCPGCPIDGEDPAVLHQSGGEVCECLSESTFAGTGAGQRQWTTVARNAGAAVPQSQRQHDMTYDRSTKTVRLFGGNLSDGFGSCDALGSRNCHGLWSGDGFGWQEDWLFTVLASDEPCGRLGHRLEYVHNSQVTGESRLVLVGGQSTMSPGDTANCLGNDALWSWNNSSGSSPSNKWVQAASAGRAPPDRWAFAAATVGDTLFLHGGVSLLGAQDTLLDDFWRGTYNFANDSWVWQQLPGLPPPNAARGQHDMVYDSVRGRLVLVGGCPAMEMATPARDCADITDQLADVYEYVLDGPSAGWALVPSPGGFPGTSQFALSYDPGRARTILHGGQSATGGGTREMWEWDGGRWQEVLLPVVGPSGARLHAAAIHIEQSRLVLLGDGDTGEVWEQDLNPAQLPSAVLEFSWDSAAVRADEGADAICGLEFRVSASGEGFTLDIDPDDGDGDVVGESVTGLRIDVWDGKQSAWQEVTALSGEWSCSRLSDESVCRIDNPERARQLVFGDSRQIVFRLTSISGTGNGPRPASLSVGYAELEVDYNLKGSCL